MARIKNRWFARNYDGHDTRPEHKPIGSTDFSNFMYDNYKGSTHALLPYGIEGATRFVGDVEIAMTQDPNITCYFSAEHRAAIAKQVLNQPRVPQTGQPTDDQLLANGGIKPLERDEIVRSVKANADRLDHSLASVPVPAPAPAPAPAPSPTPNPE